MNMDLLQVILLPEYSIYIRNEFSYPLQITVITANNADNSVNAIHGQKSQSAGKNFGIWKCNE